MSDALGLDLLIISFSSGKNQKSVREGGKYDYCDYCNYWPYLSSNSVYNYNITLGNWYHSSSLAISWFSWLMNHEITIITTFLFSQKVTRYTKYTIIATLALLRKVMREADEKLTINK